MGHIDVKTIIGIIGNITSIFLFTAPIPTFIKIVKERSVGEFSGIPYVTTILNCFLWILYGLPVVKFQVLVVSINGVGAVLEFLYIVLYFLCAQKKMRMKVAKAFTVVVVAFIAITVLVLKLVHNHKKRMDIIGSICVVFSIIMYFSPLTVMRLVIRTRSVKSMPFLLSLFMFLNGAVWFAYAFIGGIDIYILIPNGLGCVGAIAQLCLYAWYKNATPREDLDEKGNPINVTNPV